MLEHARVPMLMTLLSRVQPLTASLSIALHCIAPLCPASLHKMLTCTATQCGCLHLFSVVCQSNNKNSRSYFAPSQGMHSRSVGQNVNFGQNQYYHPNQQNQQNQPTQRLGQSVQHSNFLQNCQNTSTGTALRRNNLAPTRGNIFFKCCDPGHYSNRCPKRNIQNIPDNQVQHWWTEVTLQQC